MMDKYHADMLTCCWLPGPAKFGLHAELAACHMTRSSTCPSSLVLATPATANSQSSARRRPRWK